MSATPPRTRQLATAGWLLVAMIVLVPAAGLHAINPWPGALAGWLAAALLWHRLAWPQRRQALVLGVLGIAGLAFAWVRGAPVPAHRVATQNHLILCMLAAVSFLRLVSQPVAARGRASGTPERLPVGPTAALRTLLGVHAFGAVINLSAVVVIGDRLARGDALDQRAALLLSRGFTCAVFYSPFFGGTALALTLASGARLPVLVAAGLPLALAGLCYALWDARRGDPARLRAFRGFPTDFSTLRVPALLALGVLATHGIMPRVSVLTVIAWLSPTLVLAMLVLRAGLHGATHAMSTHVTQRLPEMSGELVLFLAAGLLASGLTGTFGALGGWLPFHQFDGTTATAVMCLTVLAAMVGLHPVITLTAAASLILPMHPNPDLLAIMFVCGWGIGTSVSPMAVTHLTMQGRYGIDAWVFPRLNLVYGSFMILLSGIVLQLADHLLR